MPLSEHDLFNIFVKEKRKRSTTYAKAGDCYFDLTRS